MTGTDGDVWRIDWVGASAGDRAAIEGLILAGVLNLVPRPDDVATRVDVAGGYVGWVDDDER